MGHHRWTKMPYFLQRNSKQCQWRSPSQDILHLLPVLYSVPSRTSVWPKTAVQEKVKIIFWRDLFLDLISEKIKKCYTTQIHFIFRNRFSVGIQCYKKVEDLLKIHLINEKALSITCKFLCFFYQNQSLILRLKIDRKNNFLFNTYSKKYVIIKHNNVDIQLE